MRNRRSHRRARRRRSAARRGWLRQIDSAGTEPSRRDLSAMDAFYGDADVGAVAPLLADDARSRILTTLADGRALPASMLAAEAGVARSTASEHLGKLVHARPRAVPPTRRPRDGPSTRPPPLLPSEWP